MNKILLFLLFFVGVSYGQPIVKWCNPIDSDKGKMIATTTVDTVQFPYYVNGFSIKGINTSNLDTFYVYLEPTLPNSEVLVIAGDSMGITQFNRMINTFYIISNNSNKKYYVIGSMDTK